MSELFGTWARLVRDPASIDDIARQRLKRNTVWLVGQLVTVRALPGHGSIRRLVSNYETRTLEPVASLPEARGVIFGSATTSLKLPKLVMNGLVDVGARPVIGIYPVDIAGDQAVVFEFSTTDQAGGA